MEGYVGQNSPNASNLRKSILLYGLSFLLIGGSILFILFAPKNEPPEAEENRAAPAASPAPAPINQQAAQPAPAVPPQPAPPQTAQQPGAKAPGPSNPATRPPGPPPPATKPLGAAEGVDSAKAVAEPPGVTVDFGMARRETLERLEGDGRLEAGRLSMIIIPQFKLKFESWAREAGMRRLASESQKLFLSQTSSVSRGSIEPRTSKTIGLAVEVTPTRPNERGYDYKVSVKRTLPEVTPTGELVVNPQSAADEIVTIPNGAGMVIGGTLPRKNLVAGEDELYKNNMVLAPLTETPFQRGEEEFLIVIYPHLNEPIAP